ncbi:alkaline phosphatase family protein [Mediterranea massiliensis]|uniref:Alkaline phosphatase family protein n=1 Tax=Mediterranea massiliensis TaxID=1841865 RepID=A0ABS2E1Q6_9BACT|nr:alkaline phosphatase family protein [Mediterranea massiliensis]MBM6735561.1 alkaline phosphatase family protein [Mediterranea massiliensis]
MKLKWIILFMLLSTTISGFSKTRKTVFIIIDGVPADVIERLNLPAINEIASQGAYARAYTGGEIGEYSQTPTISAIGYTNLLTATWLNKHNVGGNSNLKPNYNYWTIFRIAKEQEREYKTAIYSSWTDNRTVLLGEGKKETGHLKIDYVCDGFDLDTLCFPQKDKELHIFDIDEHVSKQAAKGIRNDAPDLSWVYLWYTDDAGHIEGNGSFFDEYTKQADLQIERIWQAVQYREKHFDEEWMVVVTTDHGRTESGYGHGGQSERERTTWIATNQQVNKHFRKDGLSIIDIAPSICRFMGFEVPRDVLWEQDGIPFIGSIDISQMKTLPYDNNIILFWKCLNAKAQVNIYIAIDNQYKNGEKDNWIKIATVPAKQEQYNIKSEQIPASKFYKIVLQTENNHLNRWIYK